MHAKGQWNAEATVPGGSLFIDHHGGVHRRPDHVTAFSRRGIHALLRDGEHVLLIRPPNATWLELPGGGIEQGESPVQALSRELREEAGMFMAEEQLTAADETHFRTRYYASSHDAYWLYSQQFRLVRLSHRPEWNAPLEPGHERHWLRVDALHREPVHHVHRMGIDRLLGLCDWTPHTG